MLAADSADARLSPLLRHFDNVCVHVAYKGSMNRQAYAWFSDVDVHGTKLAERKRPEPPLFSRHTEFLHSVDELKRVKPWWKPQDVNRTVGIWNIRTSASDLKTAPRPDQVIWLRNTTWFVDVSHGGTPNLWTNICHWSNSMFPVFEAIAKGELCRLPLQQLMMWQVPEANWNKVQQGYHAGVLNALLTEYEQRSRGMASRPRFFFDGHVTAGSTFCMEEAIVVKEPNLQHRKIYLQVRPASSSAECGCPCPFSRPCLKKSTSRSRATLSLSLSQTRASMSTAGVARGFSTVEIRFAFRTAILRQLKVSPPGPRTPTVTYLSRPFGAKDAKLHGRAWQLRCHIRPPTFRKLAQAVFRQAGYRMVRAVFEKTTYAYQAKIISESDVFWASHGAGMVHLPLLPKDAVTVEMFNCGHFSYLYAQLALHVGVRYFVMQRTEPWCYKPQSLYGDTRKNMSKTYAYTFEEAEPVLFQAIRYHMWQDPVEDLSGREPMCDFARKHLAGTGTLPTNVLPNRWSKECAPLVAGPVAADGGSGRADDATASTESALAGSASVANIAGEWMTNFGQSYRGRKRLVDPPEGDGTPGQWTRWAGLG